jgi:hypothetical protein
MLLSVFERGQISAHEKKIQTTRGRERGPRGFL